jgi:tetratricopeptide (TPR) repeat protein
MKPSAPARSGLFSDRLAPSLLPLLLVLLLALLAGCAAPDPRAGPQSAAGAAASDDARGEADDATSEAPSAPAPRAERPNAGAMADRAHGEPDDAQEDIPDVPLTSQLMFQLLAAEIAAQRGELGSAAATYLSMARQTRDPRLARRATELALAERSLERAVPAAQLWHELSPGSAMAAQTIETLWMSAGRLADAEPLLRSRLERARAAGALADVYPQIQRALARAPDKAEALATLERLAAPDMQVAEARLALAALASAAEDAERAAAEAEAAFAIAPDDEEVAVAAAQHIARSSRGPEAAITLLQGFLARQPKALEARFALARLLAGAKRPDAAREQFEAALEQAPQSPSILFSLAQLAWQTKQPKLAEEYLQRYLDLPASVRRDDNPAWLFLGQLAEEDGRLDLAIERYGKVQRGEQYLTALARRALLTARQGRLDEGRAMLQGAAVTTNRERVALIQTEAQLLREAGRHADAVEVLGKALERLPENPELLYDHAMAAERVDRLDLMEASLRKLIALRPDHAHAYNALGYTFADRNIRLAEARELIEKALSLRPDDAHILDSLGWVLYRQGDLPGALEQLRRAYSLSPEAEIAVHLGEVLWQSGQRDEARKHWREARELDSANTTLRDTLARFGVEL